MSKISEDIKALREALAKGPTPGPWEVAGGDGSIVTVDQIYGPNKNLSMELVTPTFRAENREADSNREYIAACSPDRIQRVLDRVAELEAEVERLRAELQFIHSFPKERAQTLEAEYDTRYRIFQRRAGAALEKKDE